MDGWHIQSATPSLAPDEVHLWRFSLDGDEAWLREARSLLSAEEVARADRFRFEASRRRFTVGRAVLRRLLAAYLAMEPRDITFAYGPMGKPALAAAPSISFNASGSDDWGLVGVSANGRLGVDIEHRRPPKDLEALADVCFAPDEIESLRSMVAPDRTAAFFNGWTRKEAFLKAVGSGLGLPLKSFSVELRPGFECRFLRLPEGHGEPQNWTLVSCCPADTYTGAAAIDRPITRVLTLTWKHN